MTFVSIRPLPLASCFAECDYSDDEKDQTTEYKVTH
jgi:hypothetical protein